MKKSITLLFFGDITGKLGRKAITKELSSLKKKYAPDIIIANIENLAHGTGITYSTFEEMCEVGIDYYTSGNHIFDKDQGKSILSDNPDRIIRPANFSEQIGSGELIMEGEFGKILLINLIGQVFMKNDSYGNPFLAIDDILKNYHKENLNGILVDFHAETTSEKIAFSHHVDGRVSAVLGTHTHVQTADEKITTKGTAYISDLGFTGDAEGVIGIKKEHVLYNFLHAFEKRKPPQLAEKGLAQINACVIKIDTKTSKAIKIERINYTKNIS